MTALSIQPTFPTFTGADGQPLENGYIWIGTANLNPITNPITVYWDAALSAPATQPIRTLGGYPSNSGTPARMYVNSDYSIQVLDRKGSVVYSAPVATERYGGGIINAADVVYDPAGTGAVATTVQTKLREWVSVKDFGAVGDGVTDDTAAIQNADAYCTASGKTLYFSGTFLVSSALTFTGKSNWLFQGATGTTSSDLPQSRLIKKSTVAGDLLTFTGGGIVLDNLAIVGQVGNTGCGLTLLGNSPKVNAPFITGMGSHGLRIGSDVAGSNMNSFIIENPRCIANTGCGIYLHDAGVNANSGSIINPICTSNISHGLYINKAGLGVSVICPTLEANTGYGLYLDAFAGYIGANVMVGGDIEANTAGNVYQVTEYAMAFINTSVQGKTWNTFAQVGTYAPVVTASVSSGAFTGYAATGSYTLSGASVDFAANISWTSNATANGQPYITLPKPIFDSSPTPAFVPVTVIGSGITLTAGYTFCALIYSTGQRIQLYQTNGAAILPINFPAGATGIYISGSYTAAVPVYYVI